MVNTRLLWGIVISAYEGVGFFLVYYLHAIRNLLGREYGAYDAVYFSLNEGTFYGLVTGLTIFFTTLIIIVIFDRLCGNAYNGSFLRIVPSIFFTLINILPNLSLIFTIKPFEIQLLSGTFLLMGVGALSILLLFRESPPPISTRLLEMEHSELLQIFYIISWGTIFTIGAVIAPILIQWQKSASNSLYSMPIQVKKLLILKLWDSVYFVLGMVFVVFIQLYLKLQKIKDLMIVASLIK